MLKKIYGSYKNVTSIEKDKVTEEEKKDIEIREGYYDKFLFEKVPVKDDTRISLRKEKFESALKVEDSGRDYEKEELKD